MRFRLIAAAVMLSFLYAQETGGLQGVVKDAKTGDPLIGVNILVKGTYYLSLIHI